MSWRGLALAVIGTIGLLIVIDQTIGQLGLWAVAVFAWWIISAAAGFLYGSRRGIEAGQMLGHAKGQMTGFEEGFRLAAFSRSKDDLKGVPDQELDDERVSLQMVGHMTCAGLRRHLQDHEAEIDLIIIAKALSRDEHPVFILSNRDHEDADPLYMAAGSYFNPTGRRLQ